MLSNSHRQWWQNCYKSCSANLRSVQVYVNAMKGFGYLGVCLFLQGSSDVSSETVQDLHRAAKALHIEYSQLKMETAKKFEELQYIMKQVNHLYKKRCNKMTKSTNVRETKI